MNKSELIAIRDFKNEDLNFIYATWLRSLYYGDSWFSETNKDSFMRNYHKVIDSILKTASVKIACLKEDPEVILGYSVYRGNIIDFVFVKKMWRGIGIAKSLVPKDITKSTHATKVGLIMIKKRGLQFDPFDL